VSRVYGLRLETRNILSVNTGSELVSDSDQYVDQAMKVFLKILNNHLLSVQ
jgi:hypothetical protein